MIDKFSNKSTIDKPSFDQGLFWVSLILIAIGLIMVYSSSISFAESSKLTKHQNYFFLVRQSIYISLGFIVGFIIFQIPIRWWQKMSPY